MQVLVCAEAYGFGPVSKAVSIVKEISRLEPNAEVIFYGEDLALNFARNNSDLFHEIIDSTTVDVETLLSESRPDGILSAMDPFPIISAKSRTDPTVTAFVDSLFWYWSVEDTEAVAEEVPTLTASELGHRTEDMDFHEIQIATHSLVDISYVQGFPAKRDDELSMDVLEPIEETGPIIDTSHKGVGEPRLVVSLAGMLSPVVSLEDGVLYAETVLDELERVIDRYESAGIQPIVVGNERVLNRLESDYAMDFLPHDRYLEILDTAILLVCPPSIMSVYEAVAYEVPVVLLPELSPSHWPDYQGLNSAVSGTPFDGGLFGERIEYLRDLDDDEIHRIFDILARYRDDPTVQDRSMREVFESLKTTLGLLEDEERRRDRARHQRQALEAGLPSMEGAHEVAVDFVGRLPRGD